MKLFAIEHSYTFKIILFLAPLIAGTLWYCYMANPFSYKSGFVEHFFNRARKLHADGKPQDAKKEYLQLLEHDPDCAAAHFNIAQLYAGDELWEQACVHYKKALEGIDQLQKFLVHFCYGTALFRLNKLEEAKIQLDQSLALHPTTKAYMQRSLVLQQLGQLDAARIDLDMAVKDEQSYARGYIELGNKYRDKYEFNNAINCYSTLLNIDPNNYAGHLFLADATHLYAKATSNDSLIAEVQKHYQNAILYNPQCYQAKVNLGIMNMEENNDLYALKLLEEAYADNPNFLNANLAKGICHLKLGDFEKGWPGYEWRTKNDPVKKQFEHIPEWDGKTSLKGQKIILFSEQGYGDTFHFIRYAELAKQQGAYVFCHVQERIKQIISLTPYIDQVITQKDPIPNADFQLPLLSMPTVLNTSIKTIPCKIPYLYADPTLQKQWHQELKHDEKLRVGICWQVNAEHDFVRYSNDSIKLQIPTPRRSVSLDHLKPFLNLEGISFYSLMYNPNKEECLKNNIHIFSDMDIKNGPFMDTAAIIKNLDLVITVDTSIAHLSAALGTPTWIILPFAAEWRWMKNRSDTPWYPTAKLFRSTAKNDWETPIMHVCSELQALLNNKQL